MKQLLLLSTLITITTTSFSQLNKNQFLVGGNASFYASKYGDIDTYGSKNSQLDIAPNIGYFVLDKLATGAEIGYSKYKTKYYFGAQPVNNNESSIFFSPFVRYYALKKANRINIFGQINYSYYRTKSKIIVGSQPSETTRSNENGFNFKAGPVFFLNPYIAIELSLSYATRNPDNDFKRSEFMTGLGFQIHLNNKKKAE